MITIFILSYRRPCVLVRYCLNTTSALSSCVRPLQACPEKGLDQNRYIVLFSSCQQRGHGRRTIGSIIVIVVVYMVTTVSRAGPLDGGLIFRRKTFGRNVFYFLARSTSIFFFHLRPTSSNRHGALCTLSGVCVCAVCVL